MLQAASQMVKLYTMMMEKDATMLEINPMVEAMDMSGQKKGDMVGMVVTLLCSTTTLPMLEQPRFYNYFQENQ